MFLTIGLYIIGLVIWYLILVAAVKNGVSAAIRENKDILSRDYKENKGI